MLSNATPKRFTKVVNRYSLFRFSAYSLKNRWVFNISGTPRNCMKLVGPLLLAFRCGPVNKKSPGTLKGRTQVGHPPVIETPGWNRNRKTYKSTCFFTDLDDK